MHMYRGGSGWVGMVVVEGACRILAPLIHANLALGPDSAKEVPDRCISAPADKAASNNSNE